MWCQKHFLCIDSVDRVSREINLRSTDGVIKRLCAEFCTAPHQNDVYIDCNFSDQDGDVNQGMCAISLGMKPKPIKISIPHYDGAATSLEESRLSAVTKMISLSI